MITGAVVAMVTPMKSDGSIDFDRVKKLVDFHIEQKIDAIAVCATTGESPTVTFDEQRAMMKAVVDQVAARIPVIAGAGANSTHEAIELARFAKEAGADATLSVVPYYNKPTQEGMYQHFKAVAEAVDIPMILYNVPSRTVCDLTNDTVLRLAGIPNIIGIKDATGDLNRGTDLLVRAPMDFMIYSGDDSTTLPLMMMGAKGCISVTANLAPNLMHEMCKAALEGRFEEARAINARLFGLHKVLFVEPNPIPVKWAASEMGLIENNLRLPMTPLSEQFRVPLAAALKQAGLI